MIKRRHCLFLWIVIFVLTPLGFSWPGKSKEEKNRTIQQNEKRVSAPLTAKATEIRSEYSEKSKPLTNKPSLSVKKSTQRNMYKVYSSERAGMKLPVSPFMPVKTLNQMGVDSKTIRLRKEIQDIMTVNRSLKVHYQQHAVQIQNIREQAKRHEVIMQNLEMAKASKLRPKAAELKNAILTEDEKALRNKQKTKEFLEKLGDEGSSPKDIVQKVNSESQINAKVAR